MSERLVEVSAALALDIWGGPPDAETFKRSLVHGAEIPGGPIDGYRAFISDGIPDDAVVAGPELHDLHQTWEYRVISDKWPDDGRSWFTPVATWESA